ncbi:MAG: hypothetical protein H6631_05590 [Anaerolineaceae bacterium]|nr:hypothetical protein [Anaerolineaceae bacterium]
MIKNLMCLLGLLIIAATSVAACRTSQAVPTARPATVMPAAFTSNPEPTSPPLDQQEDDSQVEVAFTPGPSTPLASTFPASASSQPELISALGGALTSVFVQDQFALAGIGLQLVSLDLTDPAQPKPLGSLLLPQSSLAIYADGDITFAAHAGGVSIIDIADPATPAVIGRYDLPGTAIDVTGAAGANEIYVAYQSGYDDTGRNLGSGLAVVDVADPARPLELSRFPLPDIVNGVTVASQGSQRYAYLAEQGACRAGATERFICAGRLRILDVSDASRPVEAAVFDTERIARQVAVSADRAYVAQNQCDDEAGCRGGVTLLDISDPTRPRVLGFHNRPSDSVVVAGSHLYLGDSFNLLVVDVSDPAAPQEVGYFEIIGRVEAVVGPYLYLADRWYGALRVVDISQPVAPTEIGAYDAPGPTSPRSVKVAGDYAYATDDIRRGLAVIDVSNPATPQEVGFVAAEAPGQIWAMRPPYLYLGEDWSGLRLIDLSMPTAPVIVGDYRPPDGQRVLAMADGYAYVTTAQGWEIVDLSTPGATPVVGTYETTFPSSWLAGAAVQAEQLASVVYEDGWHVVNWTDPAAPRAEGFTAIPGGSPPLVAGRYAYLGLIDRVNIFDVSHPAEPVMVGVYPAPGAIDRVAAVRDHLALVVVDLKLHLIDVSDPAAPVEVGVYDGLQPVNTAALAPGPNGQLYAYLYSSAGRLEVVDVSNPAAPLRLGSVVLSTTDWLPAGDIVIAGQYAYLSGPATPSVLMIDIANPAEPFEAGRYQTEGGIQLRPTASGAVYAYVVGFDNNLRIVDLSNPAAPQEVGRYDAPQDIYGLVPGDNVLYVRLGAGLGQEVIQRLDSSNPAALRETGRYETGWSSGGLAAIGDYLYLQSGQQVARVVDVADPAHPVEVGQVVLPSATGIEQVFAAPNRLYLVAQQPGDATTEPTWVLHTIDLSTPTTPTLMSSFTPRLPALARILAAAEDKVYFVDQRGQLRVVDLADPAAPQDREVVANFNPAGYIQAMDLAANEVYVGVNELGLVIFKPRP